MKEMMELASLDMVERFVSEHELSFYMYLKRIAVFVMHCSLRSECY